MKKYITILLSVLFISSQSVAEVSYAVGITGALHNIDTEGKETLRTSGKITNTSVSEEVAIGEIFAEIQGDNGFAIGVSYIPARELGNKSRTDSTAENESPGTYKAAAEIQDAYMVYLNVPFTQLASNQVYGILGAQHVTIATLEDLNSGSGYSNESIWGTTYGVGTKATVPFLGNDAAFYKLEATFTDFVDSYQSLATSGNQVDADLESNAIKLSIGYKF